MASSLYLGETQTMQGWLIYGAALNEGRGLFKSNEQFGQWVSAKLAGTHDHDRAAAMWAAGNPEEYRETRKAHTLLVHMTISLKPPIV